MKSIFQKSGYLRVLFVGLPFGIGSLIVGLPQFSEIPETINELELHEGIISDFGDKNYYDVGIDLNRDVFFINIKKEVGDIGLNREYDFYTDRRKERKIIEQGNYQNGDKVKIWTNENDVYIKQISLNDKVIMKYEPPYWRAWFFTLAGIIFTVMSLYYLIAYSNDYFGKND